MGRVEGLQLDGNDPCEDRLTIKQLTNVNGYYLAVFDGHGGWQVAEMCNRKLHTYLDKHLKGARKEQHIKDAITKAFDDCEEEFLQVAKKAFENGFPKTAYVGSCALIAVVIDDKLYVANSGDCKGVLLRQKNESKEFEAINVSKTFSANKKYE